MAPGHHHRLPRRADDFLHTGAHLFGSLLATGLGFATWRALT
jgi:hypothetical protein